MWGHDRGGPHTAFLCPQVGTNGLATVGAGGLNLAAGSLTVSSGNLQVASGSAQVNGNTLVSGGSVSIAQGAASAAALDVFSSSASFTGTTLAGVVPAGVTGANLILLKEGSNVLFQVRSHSVCLRL